MLHIAFLELTTGTQEDLFAQEMRRGVNQCHCILKLIAKPEGASRLVVATPCPEPARERLIHEPAIG
jgi:hypothetical protein